MNFEKQEKLLKLAKKILDIVYESYEWSFGGGTALSAFYWQHRYSTDIDIFLHKNFNLEFFAPNPRNSNLQKMIKDDLLSLGYVNFYNGGSYFEYAFSDGSKIQFLPTPLLCERPYITASIFGVEKIKIETINEIVAKKIKYRFLYANSRDIMDIALATEFNKNILVELMDEDIINLEVVDRYYETMCELLTKDIHKQNLIDEIRAMQVESKYLDICENGIEIIRDNCDYAIKQMMRSASY